MSLYLLPGWPVVLATLLPPGGLFCEVQYERKYDKDEAIPKVAHFDNADGGRLVYSWAYPQ